MRRLLLISMALAACGRGDAGAGGGADPRLVAPAAALDPPRADSAPAAGDAPGCLRYEPARSELRGTVVIQKHYGPPGFGEDTLRDERLAVPVLRLDSAISVCATPGSDGEPESGVREVQLVRRDARHPRLPDSGRVVVQGTLFHAITGWHFTNVLIIVDSIRPAAPRPREGDRPGAAG